MKEHLSAAFKKRSFKAIWPYFFVLALGVLLMCFAKYADRARETSFAESERTLQTLLPEEGVPLDSDGAPSEYELMLEQRLEDTLSKVQGVGRVQVLLTLSWKSQVELAQDITYEASHGAASEGDEKNLTEKKEAKHVLITGSDGKMSPIVIKNVEPKIEGAVIVAEGGGNADIKAQLTRAAGALLNIPAHKIEILKMNGAQ